MPKAYMAFGKKYLVYGLTQTSCWDARNLKERVFAHMNS